MTIAILAVLLAAALAFIFWLLKVLKNTFNIVENMMDIIENKVPRNLRQAYDGKYYPATVIARMEFGAAQEATITDFSLYDTKKIVGFTIYTVDTAEKYYGELVQEFDAEELALLKQPVIFKNVVVYAPQEGLWTWKSAG